MGFFDWLKRSSRKEERNQETSEPTPTQSQNQSSPATVPRRTVDFTLPVTEEERELISVIVSSIAAGNYSDSTFQITNVTRIDTDKEIAAAIAAAIATENHPDSQFVLKSIERIN